MKRPAALVLSMLLQAALGLSQSHDFSGTWRLDPSGSDVSAEATLTGLIGAGVPETLHVTQPTNGTLVIESRANESHARLYAPGGTASTPVFLGEAGTITTTSEWEGAGLVSRGERHAASADEPLRVTESFRLGDGGRRLEVEITARDGEVTSTTRAIYRRIHEPGPCESWPTPCKTPE